MMDILRHDLRHAARGLRRNPLFTGVTVLTLGLGLGVITALFAVVDVVLLAPIAVDQDRLVRVWKHDVERDLEPHPLSFPEFEAWRDESRSFETLAAINYADGWLLAITVDDRPSTATLVPVSADFFDVIYGGRPLYGRWFQAADEWSGAELAAVVSERFWRRAAGGDPAFVGRRLTQAGGGRTLVVAGIAPAALDYPLGTDIWVPIAGFFSAAQVHGGNGNRPWSQFDLVGRLTREASLAEAHAELAVIHRRLVAQFPDRYRPMRVVVEPLLDTVVGTSRQVLLFLFAAAGLVFAVAGVNVAALLLMRAAGRRRELAVRVALGASDTRLARQTVTEALLLGVLGALCGLLVAQSCLDIVRWLAPGDVPRIEQATLDFRVAGFCAAGVLAWVLALGTTPVWSHRKLEVVSRFGTSALSFRGVRGTGALRAFTVAEIAAAVVVAIGAGLLVRSFGQLQEIDRGFDAANLAVVPMLLPEARYQDARARVAFYDQLLPHVAAIPGVIAASAVHMPPGSGRVGLSAPMLFEGQTVEEAATNPWATFEPVLPSYFRTLGIPIVQGRGFTDADDRDAAPVAIVSEAVARRYWPGQDPLGRQLEFTSQMPRFTVVGVAADSRYRELTRPWLTVYFPGDQFFFFSPYALVVRTAFAPESFVPAIRQTIHAREPHVPLESIVTMDALLARELSRPRTALMVAALFALVAVLLAAVGVYGVLSYEMSGRRHELAIRSALGASPARIFRSVVWRSLAMGCAGAAVGLVVASLVTRSLRAVLFEIAPGDPGTFAAGAGVLLGIVLLASYLPARRAAGADPVDVLRAD